MKVEPLRKDGSYGTNSAPWPRKTWTHGLRGKRIRTRKVNRKPWTNISTEVFHDLEQMEHIQETT